LLQLGKNNFKQTWLQQQQLQQLLSRQQANLPPIPLLQGLATLLTVQDNESWADSILPCITKEEVEEEEEAQPQYHPPPTLQLQSLQLLMSDLWAPYQQFSPETEPKLKTS
jgi:hypothetical protein